MVGRSSHDEGRPRRSGEEEEEEEEEEVVVGDRSEKVCQHSCDTSIAGRALKAPITRLFPAVPYQRSRPPAQNGSCRVSDIFYLLLLHFTSQSPEKGREDEGDDLRGTLDEAV